MREREGGRERGEGGIEPTLTPFFYPQTIGQHNHDLDADDTDTFALVEVRGSPAMAWSTAPPLPPANDSVTFTVGSSGWGATSSAPGAAPPPTAKLAPDEKATLKTQSQQATDTYLSSRREVKVKLLLSRSFISSRCSRCNTSCRCK